MGKVTTIQRYRSQTGCPLSMVCMGSLPFEMGNRRSSEGSEKGEGEWSDELELLSLPSFPSCETAGGRQAERIG